MGNVVTSSPSHTTRICEIQTLHQADLGGAAFSGAPTTRLRILDDLVQSTADDLAAAHGAGFNQALMVDDVMLSHLGSYLNTVSVCIFTSSQYLRLDVVPD